MAQLLKMGPLGLPLAVDFAHNQPMMFGQKDETPADDDQTRGALLPGRVGLFVRLAANPGSRAALLDALNRFADTLQEDPNTEVFVIALDPEDEDVVWLYEWFKSEAALEAHRETGPFATLLAEVPELLANPPGLLRIDPLRLHMQTGMLEEGSLT